VKRRDLVAKLEHGGCHLVRHGSLHDIYKNPLTGQIQSVPRYNEINERLARKILQVLIEKNHGV